MMSASDDELLDPKPSLDDVITEDAIDAFGLDEPEASRRIPAPDGAVSPELRQYHGSPRLDGIPHSSGRYDILTSHMFNMSASTAEEMLEEGGREDLQVTGGALEQREPNSFNRLQQALSEYEGHRPVYASNDLIQHLATEDHDRLPGTFVFNRSTAEPVTLLGQDYFYWEALKKETPISKEDADFVADHLRRNFMVVPFYWDEEIGVGHKPASFIAEPDNEMVADHLGGSQGFGHIFGEYNHAVGEPAVNEQVFPNGYAVTLDIPSTEFENPVARVDDGALVVESNRKTLYDSDEYGGELSDVAFDEARAELVELDDGLDRNGTYDLLVFNNP